MPRRWGSERWARADIGQPGEPTLREIFVALYGPDYRHRVAAVTGRSMRQVDRWVYGESQMPLALHRQLSEWASRPRRYEHMRRTLQGALEEELAYREASGRWAERWLRLMLAERRAKG